MIRDFFCKRARFAHLVVMAVVCATGFFNGGSRAQAQSKTPVSGAKTVDVPEGTPVIVHFYGNAQLAFNTCHQPTDNPDKNIILQVDKDVLVNGVVVVPRGSLGMAHCDEINKGKVQAYRGGPKRPGTVGYVFHNEFVFSIASTKLEMDPAPDSIDVAHGNADAGSSGVEFRSDSEFTGKLKHAVVTIPAEEAH